MVKRCANWAPRGTLPKSWLNPSLNIFSAHADCADAGATPNATTNNAIRACLRFILLLLEMRDGHAGIPRAKPADSNAARLDGEAGFSRNLTSRKRKRRQTFRRLCFRLA